LGRGVLIVKVPEPGTDEGGGKQKIIFAIGSRTSRELPFVVTQTEKPMLVLAGATAKSTLQESRYRKAAAWCLASKGAKT
jgi:hypothetical protein